MLTCLDEGLRLMQILTRRIHRLFLKSGGANGVTRETPITMALRNGSTCVMARPGYLVFDLKLATNHMLFWLILSHGQDTMYCIVGSYVVGPG